ncbi:MAG: MEDS domain-containing protein [Spirochaetia bacterium]
MSNKIDFGFTQAHVPPGTHICQIYDDKDERNEALLQFLLKGIELKERSACFTEEISEEKIDQYFAKHGISYIDQKEQDGVQYFNVQDVYFQESRFDPDRMLNSLVQFYKTAVHKGFSGARVIGEMAPEIGHISGGERLMEYEFRVNMLLQEHPITTVCQYHANEFDGRLIMDVLKVHPMMVVRGAVIHNPFYVSPEEILAKHNL